MICWPRQAPQRPPATTAIGTEPRPNLTEAANVEREGRRPFPDEEGLPAQCACTVPRRQAAPGLQSASASACRKQARP